MNRLMARRYVISGRVQGVGFRYFAERAARAAGVTGWVRNLDDGRVEVYANGTPPQLDEFESRLRSGPPRADIRGFEASDVAPSDAKSFSIR
ncbi:MAG TPA: acylphosphatase [Bryobacteraceae bacterium]|jgi:acylphosphatase|nr:acylphosphatase [Bryobacteraceae bacterium]